MFATPPKSFWILTLCLICIYSKVRHNPQIPGLDELPISKTSYSQPCRHPHQPASQRLRIDKLASRGTQNEPGASLPSGSLHAPRPVYNSSQHALAVNPSRWELIALQFHIVAMVDVLVSPGVPKPWLSHQDVRDRSLGFISTASPPLSRSNLQRSFPFGEYLPHSTGNLDPASRKIPPLLSQKDSPRASSHSHSHSHRGLTMSGLPVVKPHYQPVKFNYRSYSQGTEAPVQRAATMPLHDDFRMAPAMKTTASSGGSFLNEPRHSSTGFLDDLFVPVTTEGMVHPASSDPMWAMKAPSFGSTTDDTPSVSSSFDYLDLPKQETTIYHGLPLYSASPDQSINKPCYLPVHDERIATTPLPEIVNDMSWSEWPTSGLTEPWPQTIATDKDLWTSTGYLSTCWPGQESLDNADSIPNSTTQPLYPQITSSSSPNHLPYFKPTKTPVSSAPEPEHTQPYHQTQETSSPTTSQLSLSPSFQPTHPQHIQPTQCPLPYSTGPPLPSSNKARPSIRADLHYSDTRNAFLIECKRRGLSYKDIKRLGGFKEAESTLRGRFRTLTKAKEQRVRKPKWHDRDVSASSRLGTT